LLYKATGRRFVYDQHDLNPEVYVARFGRTGLLYRGLLLLERATYAVADHVISTIESYQETARVRGKVPAERNSIVRSAPDPDRLRRGAPDPTCRNGREYLVCYLGIMGPQDGVDHLIDAVAHLVHERGREDIQVGLLGFGDCLEELRERATRLGGVPYVTFTGKVGPDEIGRWLSTADLGATPDPKNPFNDKSTMNKTLEYMAYELPVVGYDSWRTAGPPATQRCTCARTPVRPSAMRSRRCSTTRSAVRGSGRSGGRGSSTACGGATRRRSTCGSSRTCWASGQGPTKGVRTRAHQCDRLRVSGSGARGLHDGARS
jgi:hypothetical protein